MSDATILARGADVSSSHEVKCDLTIRRPVSLPYTPPLVIAVVDSTEGFDALRERWDSLMAGSDVCMFQSFEWQRTWWRHFGESDPRFRLHLVIVWSGSQIIGIAPLCLEQSPVIGPIHYRVLGFLGRELSDYLDVITLRGREREVLECLAGHLAECRDQYDVLLLGDIPESSMTHSLLYSRLQELGITGERFISDYCPRIALHRTWDATKEAFTSGHKARLMKRFRTITETYNAKFERIVDPQGIGAALEDFITIHQERWKNAGHAGGFSEPRTVEFHRDVAPRLARRGWIYVAFFSVEGTRVAADYGFEYGGVTYTYLGGAVGDRKFLALSPGLALRMQLMADSIDRGNTVFDFMRGVEQYKYGFGATDAHNWAMTLYSHAGRTVRLKRRVALLRRSLRRRIAHEVTHLRYHAQKHGVPSAGFWSYVVRRVPIVIADSVRKARTPEQSLDISREEERKGSS